MKVLLTQEDTGRYSIQNYHLKVLQCSLPDLEPVPQGVQKAVLKNIKEAKPAKLKSFDGEPTTEEVADEDSDTISKEAHEEIVQSLLKKADEFSEKYLKAQMQYEELQESVASREERLKSEAYEEGLKVAQEESAQANDNAHNSSLSQMEDAARTLSEESQQFSKALHSVKEELIGAALDIAKEVIVKELNDNAQEITIALAQKLMEDIDNESKIRLKVNPEQLDAIKAAVGTQSNVTVEANSAVQVGGVIVISKMGTIEADIMSRYEQIKRSALNP